jgi:hypothetical protein
VWTGCALDGTDVLMQRDRAHRIPHPTTDEGLREATDALVVSSLVSSVYVRLGSLAFESMRKCRSRTRAFFGELLSQLLKIGRSAIRSRALAGHQRRHRCPRQRVAHAQHCGVPFPDMRRAVLDSNAIDPLIDLVGAYETLRAAVDDGRLRLLFTHVNIDELAVVSDAERRSRLLLAMVDLGQLVPTGACVADVSRCDFARLVEDVDAVEALRSGNIDHTRDALSRPLRSLRSALW